VAVVRPCLVAQRDAAGAMLRCALPPVVPNAALRHPRLIPTDPDFGIQLVHADDVADAIARIIDRGASGAFNLAAEPVLRAGDIVEVLQARSLPLSSEHSRRLVALAWKARLHPLDPGWVDMALQVPWMDTEKARRVLGWTPRRDAREVLGELVDAMGDGAGTASPALRRRQLLEEVGHTLRHGPTSRRERT
jgi:nucleoside-diphosphate-sugar epimerase